MSKINPHYDPEKLGLEMLSFEDPESHYDFNTICFWATPEGMVFTANDSGCSCPKPFADYEGKTQKEVIQKLERIGSVAQAESCFDSWNKLDYRKTTMHPQSARDEVSAWVKARLK